MRAVFTMHLRHLVLLPALIALSTAPAIAAAHSRRTASAHSFAKHPAKTKLVGQRTIDDDRATQIQSALIRAGYLTGSPSGHWDADTEAAMGRLQADNGWQTKLVPDSRALIKLGLGPSTASVSSLASPGGSLTTVPSSPLAPARQ
jgi:peptidoglycan hydrolase-like protein with peptidoglycan-binding domain